jgi:hypothetical protein
VRRHARRSLASGRSQAQKLVSEGRAQRGEDGEASAALTQAREAARWLGNDGKSVSAEGLGGGAARARRGGEESGDGCGEDRTRASAFIGAGGRQWRWLHAVKRGGDLQPSKGT